MAKKKSSAVFDAGELQDFHAEFKESLETLNDQNSAHASILKRMEKQGYNRAAFKQVAKLLRYEDAKAQDYWRAFHQYAETLGLTDKIDSQGDLIDEAEAAEAAAVG